jgi:hypothetical protein
MSGNFEIGSSLHVARRGRRGRHFLQNVDLNRNFQNFSAPLPQGALALVSADVSRGQYTRPNGLFYGGTGPTWSNQIFHQVLCDKIWREVQTIIVLDLHTGLGPPGYGEPICGGPIGAELDRAKSWFGPEVTSTADGTSTSADVADSIAEAFHRHDFGDPVTFLSLEYGTVSMLEVFSALRADNWLHTVANRKTPLRNSIKREIRDAFYIDQSWWKAAVYGRFADFVLRAHPSLACPVSAIQTTAAPRK